MKRAWLSLALLAACTPEQVDRIPTPDLGPADAGEVSDAGDLDEGTADGGAFDSGGFDLGSTDQGTRDTGTADEGIDDAGRPDMGAPPAGDPPLGPPYSGGTCPTLSFGATSAASVNPAFPSGTDVRQFRLIVPSDYDASRSYPMMFAWHWLNASSSSFVRDGELESAADQFDFIIVAPDSLKDSGGDKVFSFDWPFVEVSEAERDLVFFDDMYDCVTQQFNIDRRRVYGIGVSAGALWLSHLLSTERVDRLAAVEILSGGLGELGGVFNMQYTERPRKFPALVLWGGPSDWLGLSFHDASMRLSTELQNSGNFVMECIHDAGHGIPPITPPMGQTKFTSLWQFMLDHPYGTTPGTSPYQAGGIPAVFPDWCALP